MLTEAMIALAGAGGAGLVQAMATDAWAVTKTGAARLLGRGDQAREALVAQQLERARVEVGKAGPAATQVRLAQQAAWTARLEDLLAEHPELADELRAIVALAAPAGSAGDVDQRVLGLGQAQQAVLGHGTQTVTFGQVQR